MKVSPSCPIRTTLEMLGGKWAFLILHALHASPMRFGALNKAIPDISEKMLAQELKRLADNGLVERKNYGEVPPKVDYRLTNLGKEAHALITPIRAFGLRYLDYLKQDQL